MTAPAKEFVLRQIFKNISSLKEGEEQSSPVEEHFNVPWKTKVGRRNGYLSYYLYCEQPKTTEWSIVVERVARLFSIGGKIYERKYTESTFSSNIIYTGWGRNEFIKWEDLENNYMVDGDIMIETYVKIKKMTGIERKKLKNFDASMSEFSDVVLIVEDEKFYISKLFLASQSSYFKSILMGKQEEIQKREVTLENCKSKDFQYFLELIYGESPIDDETIDGILGLADVYDVPIAMRKCEEFLIRDSEKTLKEKLRLAKRYYLNKLKENCISKITTAADLRSVFSYDFNGMDPSVVGALLQKSIALLP
ncbi:hypothetical protein GCK72_007425 [Caenorhabditis remanei]|uniref:BTB domain-containing protein n=1 Tax=Caenorhabditis remanei TaxID=31234 RepID=A0A6A5HLA7_CAERE|nr:hypothetical protein GCK72_007425 [Caenorhabditis remanei]KAF1767466.1 hypothetical protein GCK72_007425 [Caenorhabditis remanei]